jgi:hypothetical protein
MTHDDNNLRSALRHAAEDLGPTDPGFAARAAAGGRRRLVRRRVAVSAMGLAGVLAVGGTVVANGAFDPSENMQPAAAPPGDLRGESSPEPEPDQPVPPVEGPCIPGGGGSEDESGGYADLLPPEELPSEILMLWPAETGVAVTEGMSRYEVGPCRPGWVLLDVENDVVVREVGFRGPEPRDPDLGEDGVKYYSETQGSRSAAFAIDADRQLRVDGRGLAQSDLEALVEATMVNDDGTMSVGDWPELAAFEFVERREDMPATVYEWTVSGPEASLTVMATGESGPWGTVGDQVTEVNDRPAFLRPTGDNEQGEPQSEITWSPQDGVVAQLIVADSLDPVAFAEAIAPASADDPRITAALDASQTERDRVDVESTPSP